MKWNKKVASSIFHNPEYPENYVHRANEHFFAIQFSTLRIRFDSSICHRWIAVSNAAENIVDQVTFDPIYSAKNKQIRIKWQQKRFNSSAPKTNSARRLTDVSQTASSKQVSSSYNSPFDHYISTRLCFGGRATASFDVHPPTEQTNKTMNAIMSLFGCRRWSFHRNRAVIGGIQAASIPSVSGHRLRHWRRLQELRIGPQLQQNKVNSHMNDGDLAWPHGSECILIRPAMHGQFEKFALFPCQRAYSIRMILFI